MSDPPAPVVPEPAKGDAENPPVELNFETTATDIGSASQPPGAGEVGAPGVLARVKDGFGQIVKSGKPWGEFVDRGTFNKPENLTILSTRLQKNVTYFRNNYLLLLLMTLAFTFLAHPRALIWTSMLVGGWVYLFLVRSAPLVIGGREYSDREKLIGMGVLSAVVIMLTGVASTVLWGVTVGSVIVLAHAGFKEPEDLFLDDHEQVSLFAPVAFPMFTQATPGAAV